MITTLVIGYLRQRAAVMIMLLGACLLTAFGADSAPAFAAIVLGMALLSWMFVPSGINAFTCALPIPGRDLVMSRVLGVLAVVAIPLAFWAWVEVKSDQTPATLLMPGMRMAALALVLGVTAAGAWIHHAVPDALPLPSNGEGRWRRFLRRKAGTDAR